MIHAKTAVVDGKWARVGSTNLNVASWMGNWELDVTVEDERFARAMEEMYCRDLENSTEIVLSERRRVRPIKRDGAKRKRRRRTSRKGSASRAAPRGITYPLAFFGTWMSVALFMRGYKLHKSGRAADKCDTETQRVQPDGSAKDGGARPREIEE
jgi:hypothetical protein